MKKLLLLPAVLLVGCGAPPEYATPQMIAIGEAQCANNGGLYWVHSLDSNQLFAHEWAVGLHVQCNNGTYLETPSVDNSKYRTLVD